MPLKVSDGMGAWIHDFKKSDAPQFKGKSEKERRDQAIAAYMAAKKEGVNESDASWAAAKEKEKMDRLTPGDQDKISKIRKMLDREKARKSNQANRASQNAIVKGHKFAHPKPTKEEVQEGAGSLKPGWMLKKDPELAKKLKDKIDLAKKRQATYGDKSAGKSTKEEFELGEETNFEVSVEGLPKIYMKGKSPGAVKANLRKLLRQQKSILDVQRITPAELKGVFRLKAQGKDDQQGSSGDEVQQESNQQDKKPPFDGPYKKVNGPHKDQFGNIIKVKNMAKHLAKKGMKAVQQKNESVNEISGELAQRYHDKAVKAPTPHNKKDPIGHVLKRFSSMQKAQDIIHRDALKKIGSKK